MNRPNSMASAERGLEEVAGDGEPGERAAVVVAGRGVGVEHLGQPVRAGVGQRRRQLGRLGQRGAGAEQHARVGMARIEIAAAVTSRRPSFLPRYSGVRPTISPARNTAMIASTRMPYSPAPDPARRDLAEQHVQQRAPRRRGRCSCRAASSPRRSRCRWWRRRTAPSRGCRTGPPCPPARAPAASAAGPFGCVSAHQATASRPPHSTPITASSTWPCRVSRDHDAERAGQADRDDQQQEDLEQVGPGVRVLERVRGVGVEDPAAVGAQLLDRLLAGRRGQRDRRLADRPHR